MKQQQSGFVSLLTTIMISLLLLVVTTSLVSLETLQLRKAENSEQTMRAYYAAEAGIEDGVSKVLSKAITADQTCTSPSSVGPANYDASGAVQWTCQQVSFSGKPFGKIEHPDEARTIDPGHIAGGIKSVLLEWDQSNDNTKSYTVPAALPAGTSFAGTYAPAPIDMTFVKYPAAPSNIPSSALSSAVKLSNSIILPGGGGANITINPVGNAGPLRSNCVRGRTLGWQNQPTTYNCYALMVGFDAASDYLMRIRTRYVGTAFRMTFYNNVGGTGAPLDVSDGTATIDVTAKAGNTYRRVVTKLPLNSSASGLLNYVVFSDGNICKNFDVINEAAVNPPGC